MDNVKRSNIQHNSNKRESNLLPQLLVSNSKPIRLQDWLGLTNHSLRNVLAAFRLQHSPLFAADSQPQNISDPSEN